MCEILFLNSGNNNLNGLPVMVYILDAHADDYRCGFGLFAPKQQRLFPHSPHEHLKWPIGEIFNKWEFRYY